MIDDELTQSANPRSTGNSIVRGVLVALRLLGGYIVAVAAGAILFAVVSGITLPGGIFSNTTPDMLKWVYQTANTALLFFILGLVFGLPYTIVGSLLFRFALPRNAWAFMAIGLFCPTAALILLNGKIGWDWQMTKLAAMTLPSGLVSTYLFGAIGFGLGFGRWRFA